jgi:putative phosphoribosyl transferase
MYFMNYSMHKEVNIPAGKVTVQGNLSIPEQAKAIVVFSHGSGSSRLSKRNRQVAAYLQHKKLGTLLFDLLTPEEDRFYENRFDIDLLSRRLTAVTEWLHKQVATKDFPVAYFGASTGAAAALKAAATASNIYAVVSRGGRPDLVLQDLYKVEAPTLLIVGGQDTDVLELNRKAYSALTSEKKLEIVEGATHLFEEAGALEKVAELAAAWFKKYIPQPTSI